MYATAEGECFFDQLDKRDLRFFFFLIAFLREERHGFEKFAGAIDNRAFIARSRRGRRQSQAFRRVGGVTIGSRLEAKPSTASRSAVIFISTRARLDTGVEFSDHTFSNREFELRRKRRL